MSKTKKRKLKKSEKSNEKIWRDEKREVQDESDAGDKGIVEGVVRSGWFLFILFEKNLRKVTNLDQKTCKKKTIKANPGKDSITSSLYKIWQSKVRQSKPLNNSRPRFWLFCFKDSKVVCFK